MKKLDENDLKVLFESLGQILHNQDKINKHFGITNMIVIVDMKIQK